MELLKIVPLNNPLLMEAAEKLPNIGVLAQAPDSLIYLKIDDAYIHELFPLLQNPQITKPDYFGEGRVGAHISVIYPDEKVTIDPAYLSQQHSFKIKSLFKARIITKDYYILAVKAITLHSLRKKYHLSEQLYFKKYWIDFHITIGVQEG